MQFLNLYQNTFAIFENGSSTAHINVWMNVQVLIVAFESESVLLLVQEDGHIGGQVEDGECVPLSISHGGGYLLLERVPIPKVNVHHHPVVHYGRSYVIVVRQFSSRVE